jgi:hypothetical protein
MDEAPKALLAALIPAAQLIWKWLQNRDTPSRRANIRRKIAELGEQRASLAQLENLSSRDRLLSEVDEEIEAAAEELLTLGLPKPAKTPSDRPLLVRWFLLYAPSGVAAWILHTLFFINLGVVALGIVGAVTSWQPGSEVSAAVIGFAILCLPAVLFRSIAVRIEKARAARQQPA